MATNQNATVTLNATANNPAHVKIIWVESDGTNDIADQMVAFYRDSTLPSSWRECDGVAGAPDLENLMLLGAAVGADSDLTPSGSDTHTHTETAVHTHVQDAHNMPSTQSASTTGPGQYTSPAPSYQLTGGKLHYHFVGFGNQTATNQNASVTIDSEDSRPPWHALLCIQNNTGGDDTPVGVIGVWIDDRVDIPVGWYEVTQMRGKFHRAAAGTGEIDDEGGLSTHAHDDTTGHTHIQNPHTHSPGAGLGQPYADGGVDAPTYADLYHSHSWTCDNATATNQTSYLTVNATAGDASWPEHTKGIFITNIRPFTPQRTLSGVGL